MFSNYSSIKSEIYPETSEGHFSSRYDGQREFAYILNSPSQMNTTGENLSEMNITSDNNR
jgi:hypothetical protein